VKIGQGAIRRPGRPLFMAGISPGGKAVELSDRSAQLKETTMSSLAFDPEETTRWEQTRPRTISLEKWAQFETYAAEIFAAFGMDLDTAGTRATPTRYLRALFEATSGYEGDSKLLTAFPTECHGGPDCTISQVIEGPIEFFALCEHHALPFHGHAFIGYIAHEEIIGISKLTRLMRLFARRFTVQERIGVEVADELVRVLQPHGVAVHLNAMHLCTQMRGVREGHSRTLTSFWRGNYEKDPQLRTEFLQAVQQTDH
jgi:GTP cyclohydrolase I